MTVDGRISALERLLGIDDGEPPATMIVYDLAEIPEDPEERDAWFEAQVPPGAGVVYFMPDNGRGP